MRRLLTVAESQTSLLVGFDLSERSWRDQKQMSLLLLIVDVLGHIY